MTDSAFQSHLDVESYVDTPVHDEAYSRMMFVVEQRRRVGLLTGAAGCGKSMVMRLMARDLARQQHRVIPMDATELDSSELVWELAAKLQLCPSAQCRDHLLWRRLEDELQGNDLGRRPIAILLDNLAPKHRCDAALHRLLSLQEQLRGWLTIIIAARDVDVEIAGRSVLSLCELQSTIEPLDLASLSYYVATIAERDHAGEIRFDADAVRRLHSHTGGIPRLVNRACDFARMLALDSSSDRVDVEMIDVATQQISFAELV